MSKDNKSILELLKSTKGAYFDPSDNRSQEIVQFFNQRLRENARSLLRDSKIHIEEINEEKKIYEDVHHYLEDNPETTRVILIANIVDGVLDIDMESPLLVLPNILEGLISLLSQNYLNILSLRPQNGITFPEGNVAELFLALSTNSTLKSLYLTIRLSDKEAFILAEALKTNNSLQTLSLSWGSLNSSTMQILSEGLKKNRTLQVLDVSENNLDDIAVKSLVNALSTNCSITELNLRAANFSSQQTDGIDDLAELLIVNNKIKKLNLASNTLTDKSFKLIASVFARNTSLNSMDLTDTGLHAVAIKVLTDSLQKNHTLTELFLKANNLCGTGIALSALLKENVTLTELSLFNCALYHDFKLIANSLKMNQSLKYLDLRGNTIGEEAVEAFKESTTINRTLERLEIDKMKEIMSGPKSRLGYHVFGILNNCYRNQYDRIKTREAWAKISISTAFIASNIKSEIKYSIFSLLAKMILPMQSEEIVTFGGVTFPPEEFAKSTDIDKFSHSLYFTNACKGWKPPIPTVTDKVQKVTHKI